MAYLQSSVRSVYGNQKFNFGNFDSDTSRGRSPGCISSVSAVRSRITMSSASEVDSASASLLAVSMHGAAGLQVQSSSRSHFTACPDV